MKRFTQLSFFSTALLLGLIIASCSGSDKTGLLEERGRTMAIKVTSPSFAEGQPIPPKYTCDGENISPALSWDKLPETAKSLALICDDPDAPAGTWVHWVLYDLPPTLRELPEAVETKEQVFEAAKQGRNDFRQIGYGGPCPPKGGPHRYYFKLYALDKELNLKASATRRDVEDAMKGHIVAEGQLMGTYKRK